MNLLATVETMLEAGATAEMIVAVVRRHEVEREKAVEERREKDAVRKRKSREGHAMSRDVTRTDADSAGPSPHVGAGAQVVIPFSSSLRSEEVGVGGVGARERELNPDDWPDGKASDHADQLVALVASPWLDPMKSQELVTSRGRVAAWKRDGASWEHDVLPVVTGLCANRRSRIASWKFFDPAIARSIAENRAALAIPEAVGRRQATGPPSLTDRIAAEHAEARRRVLES